MKAFRPAVSRRQRALLKRTACLAFSAVAVTTLHAEDEIRLRTVNVKSNVTEQADGPVNGYRAKKGATGTKTDVPLMLTPMSVQVVSREVMDDQQVLTIADAIKNVSGVYTRQGPDGNTMDSFNIRGFDAESYGSTYLDGVKNFSRAPTETAGLERIEVLKGPAAIMYGRIEPGGMINRVSKKPQVEQSTKIQQQVGTDNYLRTTLDSTGKLSGDAEWLYRVNIAVEDSDGFKKYTENNRIYVAPQIEWRPSDATFVRTGIEYTKNQRSWAQTYGTIGDANGPVKIPISRNLQAKGEGYDDESWVWQLTWAHEFNDAWQLQQRVTYVDRNSVARGSWINPPDADGNYTRDYWGWDDEQAKIASTNIDLTGKFATGLLQHTLLAGFDYYWEDYDSGGWAGGGTPVSSNIYNPDNFSKPYALDYTTDTYWYKNKNVGVYVQDQMAAFDDRLQILVGARYDDANYQTAYSTFPVTDATDQALTWRGGILYRIAPSVSVYASYVEGFGASNTSGEQQFDPQTSHQTEIGAKVELTPDIGFTIAVFELVKDNLTMADPDDLDKTILAGEATSKGVEFDLTGQITPHWNAIFTYAYTDVRYTKSDTLQGERLQNVPRHGTSVWSTYRFAGTGLQIGGGVTYRSDRLGVQRAYASPDSPYPYTLDEYTLFDAMVGYDFAVSGLPVRAQLNVSNATDEEYFPSSYGGRGRIAQGTPRMVMGSVSVNF
jgi:iron complex outermembrane receptor protein